MPGCAHGSLGVRLARPFVALMSLRLCTTMQTWMTPWACPPTFAAPLGLCRRNCRWRVRTLLHGVRQLRGTFHFTFHFVATSVGLYSICIAIVFDSLTSNRRLYADQSAGVKKKGHVAGRCHSPIAASRWLGGDVEDRRCGVQRAFHVTSLRTAPGRDKWLPCAA